MDLLLEITLLIGFFIAYPIYGWWSFPTASQAIAEGRGSRSSDYREVLVVQWAAAAVLTILWWVTGRNAAALGLGWDGSSGGWLAVIVVILATAAMAVQVLMVRNSSTLQRATLAQFESVDAMMPRNERDLLWFSAVSVTAGICEELLYRGFLLWWLETTMGLGTALGAVVVTIVFGLAHLYQGWRGALKAGLVGGILMGLRLLAGSIWPVIALHAAVDLLGGYMAFSAWQRQSAGNLETTTALQEEPTSLL